MGIEDRVHFITAVRYQCGTCKLEIDKPGVCSGCAKERMAKNEYLPCVVCRAPFQGGKPHQKCLAKMAKRGGKTPSYWQTRR